MGQPHTKRTIIMSVIVTLIVVFALMFVTVWRYNNSHTVSVNGVSQGGPAVSTGMVGSYGVASKMVANDLAIATPAPSPEIMPVPPIDTSGATIQDRQTTPAKIIRNGNLELRVANAQKSMDDAKNLAAQFNGFVASSNLVDNAGIKTGYITVRVPADKYDALVAEAKKLAVLVLSESSTAEDVTAQFVDLNARLTAAQAEEAQYMAILKQAKSVEDTLKVTDSLSQVRTQIEQLQGQLRYMSDKTDYATLDISMTEEAKIQIPSQTWRPLETVKQMFQVLVLALQGVMDLIIGLVIFGIGLILPVVLILWLIYLLVRWKIRKMKK